MIPELFEADAQNWLLCCCLGHFFGLCTACYLGMKFQVQSNRITFISLVASMQLVLMDISHGSHHSCRCCLSMIDYHVVEELYVGEQVIRNWTLGISDNCDDKTFIIKALLRLYARKIQQCIGVASISRQQLNQQLTSVS